MTDIVPSFFARSPAQLGHLIRQARLAKGWTQADLAGRISMYQPMVSMIERGHPGASLTHIFDLLAALDLDLSVSARSKSSSSDIDDIF